MIEREDNPSPVIPPSVTDLSLPGWLLRGAIREDDLGFLFGFRYGPDPHDDPNGPFWRVMHHFYDPLHNAPLTLSASCRGLFALATGDATDFRHAPNWGLGAQDAFAQPLAPEHNRRNHFTLLDAYEAMYRALTGRDSTGKEVAKTREERNRYWATTFRALGDIVHLIQDMAQPQHTRNDRHSGACVEAITGHKSLYEAYIEARATGESSHNLDRTITTFPPLTYGDYPIPQFPRAADFFSTQPGGDVAQGLGLADYSNRGFFSAGTNLGDNNYPSPSNDPNAYTREILTVSGDLTVSLLKGSVPDTLTGVPATGVALTTESLPGTTTSPTRATPSRRR